jgi:hypothetical protein
MIGLEFSQRAIRISYKILHNFQFRMQNKQKLFYFLSEKLLTVILYFQIKFGLFLADLRFQHHVMHFRICGFFFFLLNSM